MLLLPKKQSVREYSAKCLQTDRRPESQKPLQSAGIAAPQAPGCSQGFLSPCAPQLPCWGLFVGEDIVSDTVMGLSTHQEPMVGPSCPVPPSTNPQPRQDVIN